MAASLPESPATITWSVGIPSSCNSQVTEFPLFAILGRMSRSRALEYTTLTASPSALSRSSSVEMPSSDAPSRYQLDL